MFRQSDGVCQHGDPFNPEANETEAENSSNTSCDSNKATEARCKSAALCYILYNIIYAEPSANVFRMKHSSAGLAFEGLHIVPEVDKA